MIGKTLAHYEILDLLGKGGMGEVYRARDAKLDRDVALKILPQEFSGDVERAARFEREARMLASLQHTNIASIYGYEHVDGVRFLVMELAEGEDLAQRMSRGAIPLDDILRIAEQIAIGLEAAHRKSIIHRDLKPGNVKVDAAGSVKILDFGLARAYAGEPLEAENLETSPTITAAMTQAGVILGTAAYMSPEQAKGKSVDHRSDIWSYGVMLFEMLSNKKLFEGETVSETMAEVMKGGIDWSLLPGETPSWLERLLRRCLDRDPHSRLQSIGEARIAIQRGGDREELSPPAAQNSNPRLMPALIVAAALCVFAAVLLWYAFRVEPAAELVHSTLLPPDETYFAAESPFAVSRDGRRVAFVASSRMTERAVPEGTRSIWVRDLSAPAAQQIEGTEGAQYPFWSPDGRMLGFFADGKLKKVNADGGPVVELCSTENGRGGSWNQSGTIIFQQFWSQGLMKIHAGGGSPETLTTLNEERFDIAHRWPVFLPDGNRFLFFLVSTTSVTASEHSGIYMGSLDSDEIRLVLRSESRAMYSQRHLIYRTASTLMARPIDEASLEFSGDATPIATDVPGGAISWGGAHFGVSSNGVLVHLRGAGATNSALIWRDLEGNELGRVGEEAGYWEPSLSHDDRYVAVSEGHDAGDIWIHDLEREVRTRFTFHAADDRSPLWSPDDKSIAFSSARETVGEIYERRASGQGDPVLLHSTGSNLTLNDWSSDGRWILFSALKLGDAVWDIQAYDRQNDEVIDVAAGAFTQDHASLSPDGRWLAFSSNESGQGEVYVQSFPDGPGRWMVSTDGGSHPRWARDGRAIFFVDNDTANLWSVDVTALDDETLRFGSPSFLFAPQLKASNGATMAVASDGQRMLFNERIQTERDDIGASLIQNWTRILER